MSGRGEVDGAAARSTPRPRGVADIALAGLVVAIVATMIVPLPLFLLDILLTLNLSLSVVLLLVALYVPEALGIASFPTILLLTTLYRLSLDIAATRQILGRADGGEVIRAFGRFVVHGNYVVGGVVFVILTLVQFLVIAKGGERVAEVAARFTLDAMPGKQMAVDAELRAGAIDQGEARRRRRLLARESSFYGAMDGAMKFVKGDAVAGIVIAFVNIVGGLAIGVGQRGMSAGDALQRYGLLTIGEGLVAQIPALIISTAAGILVTRVATEEPDRSLGREIAAQLVGQPRALGIAAALLGLFALAPGMPAAPFLLIAAALAFAARAVGRAKARQARETEVLGARGQPEATAARSTEADRGRDNYQPAVTPIAVELGDALAPLIDASGGADAPLRMTIPAMREELFRELGVPFPGVRARVARTGSAPHAYTISLQEVPAVVRELPAGRRLAIRSAAVLAAEGIAATPAVDPETGTPASWVDEAAAAALARQGVEVLAPEEVLVAEMRQVLRRHAAMFVGIQETQSMLDALEQTHPALVRNVVPKPVAVTALADVLRRLVEEGISVRNLRDILEGIAPYAAQEKDPLVLAELARQGLRRQITHAVAPGGRLAAWFLSPDVNEAIRESIVRTANGSYLRLDPRLAGDIREAVALRAGEQPAVVLVDGDVRRYAWVLLEPRTPRVRVITHGELSPGTLIEALGTIGP